MFSEGDYNYALRYGVTFMLVNMDGKVMQFTTTRGRATVARRWEDMFGLSPRCVMTPEEYKKKYMTNTNTQHNE